MRHDPDLARLVGRSRRPLIIRPRTPGDWITAFGIRAAIVALVLVPGRYLVAMVLP